MTVTLIGSGNLATNLGHALKGAGVGILQIYSHTLAHAKLLADELGVDAACEQVDEINMQSDVYIVAVKDDALPSVMEQLVRHLPDQLIVHTAGSMPMMGGGVFYPMQTFSRQRIVPFRHIPIFLETKRPEDMRVLRCLAELLSDNIYELSSDERRWLHVAAVFCCNFTNHMATLASRLLEAHDIPFSVMLPLMEETIQKLHTLPPREAQTGPAARGDQSVMERHVRMLLEERQDDLAELYKTISQSIQDND